MRVFKLSDGTSWIARPQDGPDTDARNAERTGWEAIIFDGSPAVQPQRLVYRPSGWLTSATPAELAAAFDEAVAVRLRWGGE